jgi:hypothetical protein
MFSWLQAKSRPFPSIAKLLIGSVVFGYGIGSQKSWDDVKKGINVQVANKNITILFMMIGFDLETTIFSH